MPYILSDTLPLPFTGRSPQTIRTSHQGAENASERADTQCLQLLSAYKAAGELTDQEMSDRVGIQRSSVIPRRRELMKRGLVQEVGQRKNPASGVINTTFGLSER